MQGNRLSCITSSITIHIYQMINCSHQKGFYCWLNVWCAYCSSLLYLIAKKLYVFWFLSSFSLEIMNIFLKYYFLPSFWILKNTVPVSLASYIIVANWGCCHSDTEDRNLVKSRKLSFKSQKVLWFIAIQDLQKLTLLFRCLFLTRWN